VTAIATSAIPAFTSKPDATKSDPVVTQQIKELQDAVTKNARELQTLAEHLQKVIASADEAAAAAKRQVATYKALVMTSLAISAASLATAIFALVG
jgi:hypothetical protein